MKDSKNKNISILIQTFIFVSVSPLFDNIGKILFSTLVLGILYIYRKSYICLTKINLIIILFFFCYVILYGLLLDFFYSTSFDFIGIGFWISIMLGYFLSLLVSKEEVLLNNERLMFWSVLIGIPIFLLSNFFPIIKSLAFTYSAGEFTHKSLGFLNFHVTEEGFFTDRFVGIGREPGVTQIFLLLAIWNRLKRISKFDIRVIILIAGLLLGKSTAGFFTLLLVLFLSIPFKKLLLLLLLSFPVIIFLFTDLFVYHTDNKLLGSVSFLNRYGRYIDFFTRDWIGILGGYGNVFYIKHFGDADLGGWDTLLQVSQRYGILFFILIVILLFISNRKTPIVFLIIFISFFSQLVWFYPIVSFFYFNVKSRSYPTTRPFKLDFQ